MTNPFKQMFGYFIYLDTTTMYPMENFLECFTTLASHLKEDINALERINRKPARNVYNN